MLKFVTNPGVAAGLPRLGAALLFLGCILPASQAAETDRAARPAKLARPSGVPFPAENPYSPDKAELGRRLFFDTLLSASGTIACATRHHPRLAWGDRPPRAIGASGKIDACCVNQR